LKTYTRRAVRWTALAACVTLSECAPGFAVVPDATLVRPASKRVVMSPQGKDSSKFTLRVRVDPGYRAGACWDTVAFLGQASEAGGELLALMTASKVLEGNQSHELILIALPKRIVSPDKTDTLTVPESSMKVMLDSACAGHHKWPRFPYAISARPRSKTANPLGLFALSMIAVAVLTEGWDPQ
jgi:hypothetical protein